MTESEPQTTEQDQEQERDRSRYSPAGFDAPSPERDDEDDNEVVCLGCGESDPISEMGVIKDTVTKNSDNAVLEVTRRYMHNSDECMNALFEADSEGDDQ